jgi:protein TonB
MLAYAANRPVAAERRQSPHALLGIVAGHVAVVAIMMSIRMDLPTKIKDTPLVVDLLRADDPPPPPAAPDKQPQTPAPPRPSAFDPPQPLVPVPTPTPDIAMRPVPPPSFDAVIGPDIQPLRPKVDPAPVLVPDPLRTAARLLTSASDLRPPYPESKLASGEEAVLRLRLTIDASGRVLAVEPVGRADGAFLAAARRHLMARWRYRPASEGGRAIGSSIVVSLRFQLEG